jgi:hypothetical protein
VPYPVAVDTLLQGCPLWMLRLNSVRRGAAVLTSFKGLSRSAELCATGERLALRYRAAPASARNAAEPVAPLSPVWLDG